MNDNTNNESYQNNLTSNQNIDVNKKNNPNNNIIKKKKSLKLKIVISVIILLIIGLILGFLTVNYLKSEKTSQIKNDITKYSNNNKNLVFYNADDIDNELIQKYYNPNKVDIPDKFNLKDELKQKYNIDIPVGDQKNLGLCTVFSLIKSMETNYALKTGEYIDLSERYISYMLSDKFYSANGNAGLLNNSQTKGTNGTLENNYEPLAILETIGVPSEEEIPYRNYTDNEMDLLRNASPTLKIDKYVVFPNSLSLRRDEQLKKEWLDIYKIHIMKYGSLAFSNIGPQDENYNETHNSYNYDWGEEPDKLGYYDPEMLKKTNHNLSIIGWDDNYPKENFTVQPKNNGAFILLNSWGENWGEEGYYYISYESDVFDGETIGIINTSIPQKTNIYSSSKYLFNENEEKYVPSNKETKYFGFKFDNNNSEEFINYIIAGIQQSNSDLVSVNVYINKYDDSFNSEKLILLDLVPYNAYYLNIKLNNPIKIEGEKFSLIFEMKPDEHHFHDWFEAITYTKNVNQNNKLNNNMYIASDLSGEWTKEDSGFPVYVFTGGKK